VKRGDGRWERERERMARGCEGERERMARGWEREKAHLHASICSTSIASEFRN